MYIATVKSKLFQNGMLTVGVKFSNPNTGEQFVDTFQTNQNQKSGWLEEQVTNKLSHLDALPSLHDSIEVGKEVMLPSTNEQPIKEKDQYKADLLNFERFVSALAKGFTTKENRDFIALKQKLTDNFKPEYLDLF